MLKTRKVKSANMPDSDSTGQTITQARVMLWKWLVIALVVILADQITKQLVLVNIPFRANLPVFGNILSLTHVYNYGAAFSFLNDAGGWQRWFFVALALIISTAITVWLRSLLRHDRFFALALSLILGGAIGNVVDRIIYGYVIDFIHVHYESWSFPAFNVADSAITVGAAIVILMFIFVPEKRKEMLANK